MASETRLIGAVGIKVRPVTKGFREEIQDKLRNLPDGEVKVTAKADTTKAKRELKELSEDQEVTYRVGVTHDDLNKFKRELESKLKSLDAKPIKVKLDKAGIEDALAKLDEINKKSKVVMKITEDPQGWAAALTKIRAVQREKLEKTINFKIDDKSLAEEAAKYEKLLEREPHKLTVSSDPGSLSKALAHIEGELDKLTAVEISVHTDKASLETAKRDLEVALAKAPVNIKYTQDEAGYKSVLDKIKAIRAEKLALKVSLETDEASLARVEAEMNAELERLEEKATIKIELADDWFKMRSQITRIDDELEKLRKVEIDVELDEEKLKAARADLESLMEHTKLELEYGTDESSLQAAKARIQSVMNQAKLQKLTVDTDPESLEQAMADIDALIEEAEKKKAKIPVELSGLQVAARELGWATRERTVPFYVRINKKSLAVAEGILQSLSGYNTLSSIGRGLENLVTNFDTIMVKTAGLGVVLGGLASTLIYAGTAAAGIGDGISRMIGLAATAPAALSMLTAGVLVTAAAWKNFKGGIDGNAEALESLPPAARAAATALKGTWTEIQKPIQANYWEAMGTSLQDMVAQILPQVRDGFALTATHMGKFTGKMADAVKEISLAGQLTATLGNLAKFFDNATGAAEPLVRAISTLGLRGSEYFPQFGTWLTNMSNRFNDFIQEADGLGRINQWIEEGVQSLKDMWKAGDGIVDMLRGITAAAMDAGTNNLSTFADNMQRMGEIAQGEPFRSRLATIFEGGRAGASALATGVKNLGRAFGEQAPFISDVLDLLGQLGGTVLTNIASMFSGKMFKSGLRDALSGLQDMVEDLAPSFSNMGNVIGTLGTTAGATFRGLTPLVNTVTQALSDMADMLGEELPGVADVLLRYMTNSFSAISSVVVPLTGALGDVLAVFNDLPSGVQRLLVAFGAFTIMRGQVSKLFTALGNTAPFKSLETSWRNQQMLAGNASAGTQKFVAGTAALSLARERVNNVAGAVKDVGTNASGAAGYIGGMSKVIGGGLLTAGKGLLTMLGGPWGIALAGAAVGLSLYGQKQREAQQLTEDHTAALEEQSGALTGANAAIIANNIVHDKGSAGIKSSSETLKALGRSVQDTADTVMKGGAAYDDMISQLDKGIGAADQMSSSVSEMGIPIKGNADAWKKWTSQMGIASDAVAGVDLIALKDQLVAEHAAVSRSVTMWADRNDSMKTTSGISEGMAASIKMLGDAAGDAEGRLRAYRDILDQLNGVSKTAWERQRDMSASSRDLAGFLGEVNEAGERVNGGLIDLNTGFTVHTEAGDKLGGMLDNLQTQQFNAAQQAYDLAGGQENAAAAAAAAEAATAPYRDELNRLQAQGLLSKEEVDALNRSLFGIPGSTPFELTDENSIAFVSQKLGGLHEQIQATPDKEITITEPLSPAIIKGLENLGYEVTHLPNGQIKVSEKGTDATGQKITQTALTDWRATITAGAITFAAEQALNNAARNRTAIVEMRVTGTRGLNITEADGGILRGSAGGRMYEAFANGGITKMMNTLNNAKKFANGGMEQHIAQIAYPSSSTPIRIWAEEETHGEAYIPLAASKRPRSVNILNKVAHEFGYNLQRQGEVYADGGVTRTTNGGSTGGGVAVNIGSYVTQKSDTPDDVARALMRRIKAQGAYSPLEAF